MSETYAGLIEELRASADVDIDTIVYRPSALADLLSKAAAALATLVREREEVEARARTVEGALNDIYKIADDSGADAAELYSNMDDIIRVADAALSSRAVSKP